MRHLRQLARLIARGIPIARASLQQVAARRVHRVLVGAAILALGAGFWPLSRSGNRLYRRPHQVVRPVSLL